MSASSVLPSARSGIVRDLDYSGKERRVSTQEPNTTPDRPTPEEPPAEPGAMPDREPGTMPEPPTMPEDPDVGDPESLRPE
jgi:hypothetical protein